MTHMDKDRLAAFVDGELSPEDAAAVVMHLASHPGDQAYVDDLFAANAAMAQAFSAPLHAPVPERIRSAILQPETAPKVLAFRPRRALALAALALAASVTVAALVVPGLMTGPLPGGLALGPLGPGDPVAQVFAGRLSGDPAVFADGREAMVLASHAMPDGRICRELELIDRTRARLDYALGCRHADGWRIESVIAEAFATGADNGFVPAGDAETEALHRFLEREGTPVPLDAEAEAEALRRGWTAP